MNPDESLKLSKEFVGFFKEFATRNKLRDKELRIRGGLIIVFESLMGLQLDVTPQEMEKFKNFLDSVEI